MNNFLRKGHSFVQNLQKNVLSRSFHLKITNTVKISSKIPKLYQIPSNSFCENKPKKGFQKFFNKKSTEPEKNNEDKKPEHENDEKESLDKKSKQEKNEKKEEKSIFE